jgi:preprotein translocase subunit YajC
MLRIEGSKTGQPQIGDSVTVEGAHGKVESIERGRMRVLLDNGVTVSTGTTAISEDKSWPPAALENKAR